MFLLLLFFVFYQVIQVAAIPLVAVYIILRKFKNKPVFGNFKERMGLVPKTPKDRDVIWLHAVSVGEVMALQETVKLIKKNNTNAIIYLTTGTLGGKAIAHKNIDADIISYMPYDFLPCITVALSRIHPKALILIEAELWPNLLMLSKIYGARLILLNARLKEKSLKRFSFVKAFSAQLLNLFTGIYTQTAGDKKRFETLGVEASKIKILGDLKAFNYIEKQKLNAYALDPDLHRDDDSLGIDLQDAPGRTGVSRYPGFHRSNHTTLLVGSIHPGELDVYSNLFTKLRQEQPNLRLILAPRHFQWQDELVKKIQANQFRYFLWDDKNVPQAKISQLWKNVDVLLVCKLGALFNLYQECNIFFLGGTYVPVGGHNLLEPAVWSKPSIVGPDYHTCTHVANELEIAGGLLKVSNEQQLFEKTKLLVNNKALQEQMGNDARRWVSDEAKRVEQNLTQALLLMN
jgi:3-deoxy-D-manno-octulosonic-acid transferase